MQRVPVESSFIRGVGYDPVSETLEIELANGRIYQYFEVAPAVYEAMLEAESKGRYFNENISGVYPYGRVV